MSSRWRAYVIMLKTICYKKNGKIQFGRQFGLQILLQIFLIYTWHSPPYASTVLLVFDFLVGEKAFPERIKRVAVGGCIRIYIYIYTYGMCIFLHKYVYTYTHTYLRYLQGSLQNVMVNKHPFDRKPAAAQPMITVCTWVGARVPFVGVVTFVHFAAYWKFTYILYIILFIFLIFLTIIY